MPEQLIGTTTAAPVLPGQTRRRARTLTVRPNRQHGLQTGSLRDRLPWPEIFIVVQFLWGAVLFIPGAQEYRPVIRALPYISSIALLALYFPASGRLRPAPGTPFLVAALILLVVNMLHSTSQLQAGLAQIVFQLSIAAPMFWGYKAVRTPKRLERLLFLIVLLNGLSAGLGVLQAYYPDRFMPPEFSTLAQRMNESVVDSMTYSGPDGRRIVRPPGLSDLPGGAAVAGGLTAVLGLALLLRVTRVAHVGLTLVLVATGLAAVYLTQVRSVLLMVIAAVATLILLIFRQRRFVHAGWITAAGAAMVVGAFYWASSVGGESVEHRFLSLREQGAVRTFQESRGMFVTYTVGELLNDFPLGAGVGRWGMMNAYFGDPDDYQAPPIYVEIQLTGWLLDGGFPMWLFYGGGILLAVLGTWRLARSKNILVSHAALTVAALQVFIIGMGMAGPVFNTQLGILFWLGVSVLHGCTADDAGAARAITVGRLGESRVGHVRD